MKKVLLWHLKLQSPHWPCWKTPRLSVAVAHLGVLAITLLDSPWSLKCGAEWSKLLLDDGKTPKVFLLVEFTDTNQ